MGSIIEDGGQPVPKRRRLEYSPTTSRPTSSRLFAPFRTVGLVSPTSVPFTSVPLGKATFQITTCTERSLQTYDLRRGLNLVFLSRPQCPQKITATCAYRDRVFVAWGGTTSSNEQGIWIFKRGKVVGELDCTNITLQTIERIIIFGNWIIGCGEKAVEVWKNDSYEHYTTILSSSDQSRKLGFTSNICTLPTFLNKVFVGRVDGSVEIYNISTARLVHTLYAPAASTGRVTAISPASALGVIAVAYADGSLVLYDAYTDEQVLTLNSRAGKPITSIAFRSDGMGAGQDGRKDGVMATASIQSGDITLWDLNRGGKVTGVLRGAHEISNTGKNSGITKIEFLSGQPVVISSGLDNAIRSWIFDQNPFSPIPRILHTRSGHAAPVARLGFLPAASDGSEASGKWLLSAGQDRSLWGFSLRKDGQNTELSQGNVKHKAKKAGQLSSDTSTVEDFKASPIIDIACCLNRDGGMGAIGGPVWTNPQTSNAEAASMTGWESIVTAHLDDRFARTWFWGRKKAGRWAFETGDKKPVSSVAVTACGTFALVGSTGGGLDMFNLQSGIHRQRFPPRLKPSQAKQLQHSDSEEILKRFRGHTDSITGIVVDNLNQTVVSSSLEGSVIFWNFTTGQVSHRINLDSAAATSLKYNPVSGLVALSCDDLCIRVLDIETKRIVRELWGCVGQINSHCFSQDGRWIIACSMDSVIRVFDLATGHLIDAFKTATCTNVAFSSTGEYLATSHAGTLGINIWTNKSLFSQITTRQIGEDDGIIDLTDVDTLEATNQLVFEDTNQSLDPDNFLANGTTDIDQLDKELLTLSLVPKSRWQTLLNLDSIRARNKPIQPPQKPKAAPFFLGSSLGSTKPDLTSLLSTDKPTTNTISDLEQSRISHLTSQDSQPFTSQVSTLLKPLKSNPSHNQTELVTYLSTLPPSACDLEIRSLTLSEMPLFIRALTLHLYQRRDFELVNTWMSVFLKLHGDFIAEVDELRSAMLEWKAVMVEEEKRLDRLVGYTKGVVEFLRSAR